MGEDRGAIGVDADSEVVSDLTEHVAGQAIGSVTVCDGLVISDEHQYLHAEVLETDPVGERAEQMADVQRPRRAISGQDPKFSR